jgi:hypothetical protein
MGKKLAVLAALAALTFSPAPNYPKVTAADRRRFFD